MPPHPPTLVCFGPMQIRHPCNPPSKNPGYGPEAVNYWENRRKERKGREGEEKEEGRKTTLLHLSLSWRVRDAWCSSIHRRRNWGGGGGGGGGGHRGHVPPPKFHNLLYKLLTTLCVVSDCDPPIKKSFLRLCNRQSIHISLFPFLVWKFRNYPFITLVSCLQIQSLSLCEALTTTALQRLQCQHIQEATHTI